MLWRRQHVRADRIARPHPERSRTIGRGRRHLRPARGRVANTVPMTELAIVPKVELSQWPAYSLRPGSEAALSDRLWPGSKFRAARSSLVLKKAACQSIEKFVRCANPCCAPPTSVIASRSTNIAGTGVSRKLGLSYNRPPSEPGLINRLFVNATPGLLVIQRYFVMPAPTGATNASITAESATLSTIAQPTELRLATLAHVSSRCGLPRSCHQSPRLGEENPRQAFAPY